MRGITEDFAVTIEVIRRGGEVSFRASIDGVPALDKGTAATLALRVLGDVAEFAEEYGDWDVVFAASDEEGGAPP